MTDTTTPTLVLSFLGTFQATLNGQPLKRFESDNSRALLVYLALTPHQTHRRAYLSTLLWPDEDEATGRNNLRQALFKLRKLLHNEAAAEPFLLITPQTVQWNGRSSYQLDVAQVQELLTRYHTFSPAEQTSQRAIYLLRQLVQLYTAPLLATAALQAGLGFEEWLLLTREQLHRQLMTAWDALLLLLQQQNQLEELVVWGEKQLQLDPWREATYRYLIHTLAQQNRRTEALACFTRCQQVLWTELGVPPMPETVALAEQIKAAETPFPTSETAAPHNLPADVTPFIGRGELLEQLEATLSDPSCRWLTLTGLGGMGKSRLALQLTRQLLPHYPAGCWFVPLVGLLPESHTHQLESALAAALPFTPVSSTPLATQLENYLREKKLLLLFDNFEHLLPLAPYLSQLLNQAPHLKILVTSRQALQQSGEWVQAVPPLRYPTEDEPLHTAERYEAVRLFFQQARMCRPDFPLSVVEEPLAIKICQLLEGHPLALELAAGWVDTLTCAEILAELTAGLTLLRRTNTPHPERHLSLTHVLQHSWQRLSQEELAVLNRLSFFRGGCTRASAAAVAGATPAVLKGLIQKSLLTMRPGQASARYYLHELVRSYAEQQLNPTEQLATGLAYTTYFGQLLAQKEPTLYSPQTLTILAEVGEEIDNLAVAWAWAVQQQQLFFFDQTIKVLAQFMQSRARQTEMWGWLQQARPLVEGTAAEIKLYNALTYFVSWAGENAQTYGELAQKGYDLAQAAGETEEMAYACFHLGMSYRSLGEMSKAWEVLQEGYNLAQNHWYLMVLANRLCILAAQIARPEEGLVYGQRARELSYQLGYPLSIYEAEYTLAWVHWYYGRYDLAEQHTSAALVSLPAEQFQIPKMLCMQMQAFIWHGQKRYKEALPLVQKATALAQEMGQTATLGSLLLLGGDICCQLELWSEAEKYLLAGLEIQQKLGNKLELAAAKAGLSLVYQQFGQRVLTVQYAQESLLLAWEGQEPTILYHTLLAHLRWLIREGQVEAAGKTAAGLWHYWAFADHQKEETAALCAEAGLPLVEPPVPAEELYQQVLAFMAGVISGQTG